MDSFKRLGIIEPILRMIEREGFEKPTEVQEKAIPPILEGRDVITGAATGSGKTLAFAAGIIQNSEKGKGIQALVLAPTRELAGQVSKALATFSQYKHLRVAAIYGGVSINPQMENLKIAEVVVGTPGRLLDHINQGTIKLSNVKILVLDEADRMLDMGFIEDVEQVISHCPKKRQTLLFSATIHSVVAQLAQEHMRNPVEVTAEEYVDPKMLKQVFYQVNGGLKFSLLVHLLKNEESGLVMVFCNTRRMVDFVANSLNSAGVEALAIHGGLIQEKRNRVMSHFHSQKVCVLVCTDIAARGLDIPGVSHVYNYDIPKEGKDYIHRIGRTARAGKEGTAISLLSERDYDNFNRVLQDTDVDIIEEKRPYINRVQFSMPHPKRGGLRENRFGRNRNRYLDSFRRF